MDDTRTVEAPAEQFGQLLHGLRVDRGLTQEELAALAELSTRTVSSLECGSSAPRISTTRLLARALGLDEATSVRLQRLARLRRGR